MATRLQLLARKRNFLKFRITGFNINTFIHSDCTSEEEQKIINSIRKNINLLIVNWDDNSRKIGLTPRRKTKALWEKMKVLQKEYTERLKEEESFGNSD